MSDRAAALGSLRRERVTLEVVEPAEATGIVIPRGAEASPWLRGKGRVDYACGGCGELIAIGARPGAFQSLLFACACGALNRVSSSPAWRAPSTQTGACTPAGTGEAGSCSSTRWTS